MEGVDHSEKIDEIAGLFQLATLFEVSSFKPGNVSPVHDFTDTSFEDFLRGCVALGPIWRKAVERGVQARSNNKQYSTIGLGELILDGVNRVKASHPGGNTHLGVIMLLVPLAAGAGVCIAQEKGLEHLRVNVKNVLQHSTKDDAVNLYKAIKLAKPGGLDEGGELDVTDDESIKAINEKEITFLEIMRRSAKRDQIAKDISSFYQVSFEHGSPLLKKLLTQTKNMRQAITQTFLVLLAGQPDTLIKRKVGIQKAKEISDKAHVVMNKGGVLTPEGQKAIQELHNQLAASEENRLNPGTTADLTTSSLVVYLLQKK